MKTNDEIIKAIKGVKKKYSNVLNRSLVTIDVNAVVSLHQLVAKTELEVLYWCLGKKRPFLKCDKTKD